MCTILNYARAARTTVQRAALLLTIDFGQGGHHLCPAIVFLSVCPLSLLEISIGPNWIDFLSPRWTLDSVYGRALVAFVCAAASSANSSGITNQGALLNRNLGGIE